MPLLQAQALTEFLLPMLDYVPSRRATAAEMLAHPWLRDAAPQQKAAAGQEAAVAPPDSNRRSSRCVGIHDVSAATTATRSNAR